MDDTTNRVFIETQVGSAATRALLLEHLPRLQPCVWLVPVGGQTGGQVADAGTSSPTETAGEKVTTRRLRRAKAATGPTIAWAGGLPELPADVPWPEHEGRRIPYLLGIDLLAVKGWLGLPRGKFLHVFGSPTRSRVVVVPFGVVTQEIPASVRGYVDGEPAAGSAYPRRALAMETSLCADQTDGDGRGEDAAIATAVAGLHPVGAVARLGGSAASARLRRLVTVFSGGGSAWGDGGTLVIRVDGDDLARGDFSRVEGMVASRR